MQYKGWALLTALLLALIGVLAITGCFLEKRQPVKMTVRVQGSGVAEVGKFPGSKGQPV